MTENNTFYSKSQLFHLKSPKRVEAIIQTCSRKPDYAVSRVWRLAWKMTDFSKVLVLKPVKILHPV